jgi:hypothetical protein
MDAGKEKTVGFVIWSGGVVAAVSFVLAIIFAIAGVFRGVYSREPGTDRITDVGTMNWVPMALTIGGLGVLVSLSGVGYGLWIHRNRASGPRSVTPNVFVVARFAYTKEHQMLSETWMIEEAENPRFYVRLQVAPGQVGEFECPREVFWECGEGMSGEAEIQGRWVGRFTPYIGSHGERAYDS